MTDDENRAEKFRLALLNIAATGRKWAVANGGDTPLALVAKMARDALGLTAEEVDEQVRAINWGNGIRGVNSL